MASMQRSTGSGIRSIVAPLSEGPAPAPTAPAPAPTAPTPTVPTTGLISGSVGPLLDGVVPCFGGQFPCQVYSFSLAKEGPIEVTLTWNGDPRALRVQLYWAGEGLAHEDVAPNVGPSRISFRRPVMEATSYTLRVVSLEPTTNIPYTLAITH